MTDGRPSSSRGHGWLQRFSLIGATSLSMIFGGCAAPRASVQNAPNPANVRVVEGRTDDDANTYRFERSSTDEDFVRIYELMDMIANDGGAEARALVEFFDDEDIAIMIDELASENTPGLYNPNDRSMHVLSETPTEVLAPIIIHEMVHSWQHKNGALTHINGDKDIHFTLAMTLSGEAGAQAVATLVAHKLKNNGHPEVWDEFKKEMSDYGDIMDAFETAFDNARATGQSTTQAYDDATDAAWRQYFESDGRRISYNAKTLETLIRKYAAQQHPQTYRERAQTAQEARKMAELPGSVNYVDTATALTPEQIFGATGDGVFLRALANALEAQRLGDNAPYDFSDDNLRDFGILAGLDLDAVVSQLDHNPDVDNIFTGVIFSTVVTGAYQAQQDYRERQVIDNILRELRDSLPEIFERQNPPTVETIQPEQPNARRDGPKNRLHIRKLR